METFGHKRLGFYFLFSLYPHHTGPDRREGDPLTDDEGTYDVFLTLYFPLGEDSQADKEWQSVTITKQGSHHYANVIPEVRIRLGDSSKSPGTEDTDWMTLK